MKKVSPYDIVNDAYYKLKGMKPLPTSYEILDYAKMKEKKGEDYGVVTYSKYKGGNTYFLELHDSWKKKKGGRAHIDLGFSDEEYRYGPELDTTHLMLDKSTALEFVEFIEKRRAEVGVQEEKEPIAREYHFPGRKYGMFCFTEKHEVNGKILTNERVHTGCLTEAEKERIWGKDEDDELLGVSFELNLDTDKSLRCDRCGKLFL